MLAEGNEFDDDIDEEEDKNRGNAVMSIFASYYGIEDETKKSSLSIDSPQFDANQYVTVNKSLNIALNWMTRS